MAEKIANNSQAVFTGIGGGAGILSRRATARTDRQAATMPSGLME